MTTAAGHAVDRLDGETPSIVVLREQIRRLAAFDAPGNPNGAARSCCRARPGTGKGLVARYSCTSSGRARADRSSHVNCAAIPETMLEAELFGFEAGAFTDARRAKPGLFDAASGGTPLPRRDRLALGSRSRASC